MNFLEGRVEGPNLVSVQNGDSPVPWVVGENIPDSAMNTSVLVGVRPENVMVSEKMVDSGVKAKVDVVEYLGEERSLTLGLNGTILKAIVPIDFLIRETENVWLTAAPEDLHVFDEKSGDALIKFGK